MITRWIMNAVLIIGSRVEFFMSSFPFFGLRQRSSTHVSPLHGGGAQTKLLGNRLKVDDAGAGVVN